MNSSVFVERRQRCFAQMTTDSVALFFAAPEVKRSADTDYPYRQDSDFWYLTGFNEPQAVLLLIKTADQQQTLLFNRGKEAQAEIWHGRRLGQALAVSQLAVDKAESIEQLASQLPLLLNGMDKIYHAFGYYPSADQLVLDSLHGLRQTPRCQAPAKLEDWRPWLHAMRQIKSADEIALLRQAATISAAAHLRAMRVCRPALFEYQLEAEILHEFMQQGARYPAYNTIVGGGENACILHYTENSARLAAGQLVLIDAGCEYQGYAGDITRTFPVDGRFTPAQKQIYQLVLTAQKQAIASFKPGVSIKMVNDLVVDILIEGLLALGIVTGDKQQLIEQQAHKTFYMHGLSHWLGLDVHDVGDYGGAERTLLLAPGMVLTVEPGLYIASDAAVPDIYRGIGVRIEDDILITEQGCEVLTHQAIKEIDEIEAWMAQS